MADGQERMPPGHPRPREPHHLADPRLHLRLVTVDRTAAAGRLLFPEGALPDPPFSVGGQLPAVRAGLLYAVMAPAVEVDHEPDGSDFPLQPFHPFTRNPFPCNSR